MEKLTPQEIVDSFKKALGDDFIDGKIYEREVAVKKNRFRSIWIHVKKKAFRNAVEHICRIQRCPHLAIISSSDLGNDVELIYHFTIYYGNHLEEISLGLRVTLPKKDLRIPTVTDLIPGAIFTERETQEMMGVRLPIYLTEGDYSWLVTFLKVYIHGEKMRRSWSNTCGCCREESQRGKGKEG